MPSAVRPFADWNRRTALRVALRRELRLHELDDRSTLPALHDRLAARLDELGDLGEDVLGFGLREVAGAVGHWTVDPTLRGQALYVPPL